MSKMTRIEIFFGNEMRLRSGKIVNRAARDEEKRHLIQFHSRMFVPMDSPGKIKLSNKRKPDKAVSALAPNLKRRIVLIDEETDEDEDAEGSSDNFDASEVEVKTSFFDLVIAVLLINFIGTIFLCLVTWGIYRGMPYFEISAPYFHLALLGIKSTLLGWYATLNSASGSAKLACGEAYEIAIPVIQSTLLEWYAMMSSAADSAFLACSEAIESAKTGIQNIHIEFIESLQNNTAI